MDSPNSKLDRWKKLAADKRTKAFVLAVFVLVAVVVLQVGNLKRNAPVCELFGDCSLRNIDLHRMQIALSKAGLSEFEVKDNQLLVPQAEHAKYLQAVVEQNAIPPELCDRETNSAVTNPLLSRSQQIAIERESRKQHIEQMVTRLPFVETAWFEMDDSQPRSAFQPTEKSSVISIRPIEHQFLSDQHVDTVRQMIMGAITGIAPDQIVVIDLSSGFAHRDADSKNSGERSIDAQRVAYARQQMLENRLRESLSDYTGLRITVFVTAGSTEDGADRIAHTNVDATVLEKFGDHTIRTPLPLVAGANGQASIYDMEFEASEKNKIIPASHIAVPVPVSGNSDTNRREQISVLIDVPYDLLVKRFGEPSKPLSYSIRSNDFDDQAIDTQVETYFTELKAELEQRIRPLVAGNQGANTIPIKFNLVRPNVATSVPWTDNVQAMAIENWPSVAVLAIGLILISIVTQQRRSAISTLTGKSFAQSADQRADVLALNSKANSTGESVDETVQPSDDQRAAEIRLSQLIEQDPDAAARVIESWIRDAA